MVTMTTLCSRARASLCSFSIVCLIYILCVFTRALYLCAQPQAPQQSALHMKGPRSARHNQPPGVVGTGTQMQQTQIPRIKRDNHPKFICSSTGRRLFSSLSLLYIYQIYVTAVVVVFHPLVHCASTPRFYVISLYPNVLLFYTKAATARTRVQQR